MTRLVFQEAVSLQAEGRLHEATKRYRAFLAMRPGFLGRTPDFIIIGAPRAGTNWLKKALSTHPDVRVVIPEMHYFSMRYHEPLKSYLAAFRSENFKGGPHDREGRVFGEKSPSYLAMDQAKIGLMMALLPNVRLIASIRDPVARAWSHMLHAKVDIDRLDDPRLDSVLKHGRYAAYLENWRPYASQIHLIDFADIEADPAGVFNGVCRHIGAEPALFPEKLRQPRNRGSRLPMPAKIERFLREYYADSPSDLETLRAVLGLRGGRDALAGTTSVARSGAARVDAQLTADERAAGPPVARDPTSGTGVAAGDVYGDRRPDRRAPPPPVSGRVREVPAI